VVELARVHARVRDHDRDEHQPEEGPDGHRLAKVRPLGQVLATAKPSGGPSRAPP
jgi:hypothetical protein